MHRRPRIAGQPPPHGVLVVGIDDEQDALAVAERSAEDDEAVGGQRIHEGRVLGPGLLLGHRERGVPCRTSSAEDREAGHAGKVALLLPYRVRRAAPTPPRSWGRP